MSYVYPRYPFSPPPELGSGQGTRRYPLVIVGAGPVGLCAAIDARLQGLPVILVDEDDTVSVGSRGICYAKRTLEILDRLGVGERVVAKGVQWNVGRTFHREREVYRFELLPVPDHKRPGMVNLQQYYLEQYLVERALAVGVELRWKSRVTSIESHADHVRLEVETPAGNYQIETEWLIAADGARSPIRRMLGLDIEGKVFQDRFLIADVIMQADFPPERWFWFDPPFHPQQSVLLHRQADNLWRIDFQLGWQADPEEEKKPERVIPRIQAMLGPDRGFELAWVSVYTFQCRRMARFDHGRVLFAGDAAHQVSPFGARGANSGIQDADNLIWKLALVLRGQAPASLLASYSAERVLAADENIRHSTRSTDFITPKSAISQTFRRAVLELAESEPFARRLVNSGRLSLPTVYADSLLNTPDQDDFHARMAPGSPADDAPIDTHDGSGWLLDRLDGRFHLLVYGQDAPPRFETRAGLPPVQVHHIVPDASPALLAAGLVCDGAGRFAERYDARPGTVYLLRPDQHIAARWRRFDAEAINQALARACGHGS